MRARKCVILLTVFALSALTLFLITLFDGEALGAEPAGSEALSAVPDTLDFVRESVSIGPDGNALVEVAVVLAKGGFGDLLLPFAFKDGHDFTILSGPARFPLDDRSVERPTRQVLGYRMLALELLDTAADGDTITVSAVIANWFDESEARREYGEFGLARSYINNSVFVFREFELVAELPEGMLVHSVTKVVPVYDPKKSPEPPYAVSQKNGSGRIALRQQNLAPAASVRLDLNIRPARRGLLPLIAGLIAAALYLVFFRDVLKPGEKE